MVTPSCDIPERQNSEQLINLLASASRIYGRAKALMAIQFVLTVPAALASSLIMALQPKTNLWLTFFSITVALTDVLFLATIQSRLRKRGATIQQMFDCALYGLPWRQLRCGPQVDSEDIITEAKACLRHPKVRPHLVDWYPTAVKALPLHLARLVCQRASLRWDLRQRDRVRGALTLLLSLLAVAILLIALLRGNTVEQMILTVYVPLAPAVLWIIREILAQRESVQACEKGLTHVEGLWNQALSKKLTEEELLQESILVQDALFDARSGSPMIFNWVYRLLRSGQQEQMEHKAAEMVQDALRRLGPSQSPPQV
jgi:hypothetical protein